MEKWAFWPDQPPAWKAQGKGRVPPRQMCQGNPHLPESRCGGHDLGPGKQHCLSLPRGQAPSGMHPKMGNALMPTSRPSLSPKLGVCGSCPR